MPTGQSEGAASLAGADVGEIEEALTRIAYLLTGARRHDRVKTVAAVPLDRAAVVMLRKIADSEALRPGELAARLRVEAPHVTRQVQLLQKAGYVDCGPDPDDRRAQLIQVTPAGLEAAGRVRKVARQAMQDALAQWSPQELHHLAMALRRMVDDFVAYADEEAEALDAPPSAAAI